MNGLTPRPSAQSARFFRSSFSGLPSPLRLALTLRIGCDSMRKDVVLGGDPAQRHAGLNLPDVPRTDLRAFSTGRAAPDVFAFDVGQAEGSLADELAHAELSDPVPRADRIAQSALVAGFESVTAARLDGVDDLFEGRYCLHRS